MTRRHSHRTQGRQRVRRGGLLVRGTGVPGWQSRVGEPGSAFHRGANARGRADDVDAFLPADASIGLAKLDVEGHEHAVLLGARTLLENGRLRDLIFEDHDRQHSRVTPLLEAAGYHVFALHARWHKPSLVPYQDVDWSASNRVGTMNYLATLDADRARRGFSPRVGSVSACAPGQRHDVAHASPARWRRAARRRPPVRNSPPRQAPGPPHALRNCRLADEARERVRESRWRGLTGAQFGRAARSRADRRSPPPRPGGRRPSPPARRARNALRPACRRRSGTAPAARGAPPGTRPAGADVLSEPAPSDERFERLERLALLAPAIVVGAGDHQPDRSEHVDREPLAQQRHGLDGEAEILPGLIPG